jgi:hypothetical protein
MYEQAIFGFGKQSRIDQKQKRKYTKLFHKEIGFKQREVIDFLATHLLRIPIPEGIY